MRQFLRKNRANLLALLIICVLSFVALRSLFSASFYTSHDGINHTVRIAAYYQSLKDGQWPVRWATNFDSNFGSPIFVYSYPLPYALGAAFHLTGISFQDSFRLVMALGFIFSGIFCFLWLRNRFSAVAALTGAVFYLWVPYHFLNIYVRAALAENFAYAFVPLVFLGIERKWWKFTALTLATVLLSHNEVSALVLPLFLGWAWINRGLRQFILSTIFAFSISAFIYFPDLFERQNIHFDTTMNYFRDHFVAWWQLIRSPWGYGFDFPDTIRDGISFQLGLAQILATAILGVLIAVKRKMTREPAYFLLILLASIFLMTESPIIRNVWQILPFIKTIVDFPWRFLGLTTISFAFLTAYLVSKFRFPKVLVFFLLVAVLVANRNFIRINQAASFSDDFFANYNGTATASSSEYIPKWRDNLQLLGRPERLDFLFGSGEIAGVKENASELSWTVIGATLPAALRINRFYFPETTILYNGRELAKDSDWQIITTRTKQEFDDTGLILLPQAGNGSYSLRFTESPLRQVANYLSLISFTGIIFLVGADRFRTKNAKK